MNVAALLAQVAAVRAGLDALEVAVKSHATAETGDELLSRLTWPANAPCTFRTALDAGRRGELPIVKAGRTPTIRRADFDAWVASHPVAPKAAPVVGEDSGPDLVRLKGEARAR